MLDQRQNAKKRYLSSDEIYHFLEGDGADGEEWSADCSESSNDGKEGHVSENPLSDSSEEETIDIPSVRSPNSFISRKRSEIWSCDPSTGVFMRVFNRHSCCSQCFSRKCRAITVCKQAMWFSSGFLFLVYAPFTSGNNQKLDKY